MHYALHIVTVNSVKNPANLTVYNLHPGLVRRVRTSFVHLVW